MSRPHILIVGGSGVFGSRLARLLARRKGFRVSLGGRNERRAAALQRELRPALEAVLDVRHPLEPELRGIYGVIFWERLGDGEQRNVTVFADGEVDRSPCGSGTSARLAILHARGELGVGERFTHRSIVDSVFRAGVSGTTEVAGIPAVHTWVEGSAYRTGQHRFELDPRDTLGEGFLLR